MKVFYRISESINENHNKKIATKQECLLNAIKCFKESEFIIFVDYVSEPLLDWLNSIDNVKIKQIQARSESKSMRELLNAASIAEDDEIILFLEDDYLHLSNAEICIMEALQYAEYVTCYLHPDKFWHPNNGGNPYTPNENISEMTQVIKTKNHFWMFTNSTTCTFATTARVIKQDLDIWLKGTEDPVGTHDFEIFLKLRNKGRKLLQPIPSLATHCLKGFEAPLTGLSISSWQNV